jgi:hypothetical protein
MVQFVDGGTVVTTAKREYVLHTQFFEVDKGEMVQSATPPYRHAMSENKQESISIETKQSAREFPLGAKSRSPEGPPKRDAGVGPSFNFLNSLEYSTPGRPPESDAIVAPIQSGFSYEVKMRRLGPDHVLLNLSIRKDGDEQTDKEGTMIAGRTWKIIRRVKIGNLDRIPLAKDARGRPTSWLEVSVILDPGFASSAEPEKSR